MIVSVDTVRATLEAALRHAGASAPHAALQAALLIEAEMRGLASHGLLRLPRVVERIRNGVCAPNAEGAHTWRASHVLDVDGQQGLGPVVAMRALDAVCERAAEGGVAVACIRNNNHLGMLAWYAQTVAERGYTLIALSTSEALVHPWGGRRAMLGTNPIAIGVPAGGPHAPRPLVMDMATSLVAMGKIHDYASRGAPLEAGWALDADGEPTLDAQAAKHGAIAPFGGAKGYALGLAFEVLVTALTGSAIGTDVTGTLDSHTPCNKGDVFVVIAPQRDPALHARVAAYLRAVRACEPANAQRPVSVPGDRAAASREHALAHGIDVNDALWDTLETLAAAHAV
ncbi:Ldh family oxidoreductase [Paraburkholderia acidisoli]|uniref:Ldh family oxidoreductase n=1 Tax=Paraburkholderia acidisoli TaxID=2571748 RepID=A0A7Z2GRS9_9BURK|nr:Ldh family oxidoreductase [Paraburkholderia acidisoli]QGZ66660.1 Ldh family oxidoreductase [Paraburkholderia acidisoli]